MNLKMTGIDYTRADIDIRQCFSFTKKSMELAMAQMRQNPEIRGCVLLSTCNRMELWLSLTDHAKLELPDVLCSLKGLSVMDYQEYLVVRENREAVEHLFRLSAGMRSQIMGEDQILTQVKEALAFAREQECTDRLLEVLFRMAVTAGKQVKTNVVMDKANFSAAHRALEFLKDQGNDLAGKICLVIGNGEMGKLTAQALMEEGADVTVTVRQYRSGMVKIPKGAKRIDYGERYHYIPQCSLIVSATASPNLTITKEGLESCMGDTFVKNQIYLDLAVPRDMEPAIAQKKGAVYYDMDSLPIEAQSERMCSQCQEAEHILAGEIQKFLDWQECRDLVPRIQRIGVETAKELVWRMEKPFQALHLQEAERDVLRKQLACTTGKVVDKLLFELRDQAEQEILQKTVEIMEQVYGDRKEG